MRFASTNGFIDIIATGQSGKPAIELPQVIDFFTSPSTVESLNRSKISNLLLFVPIRVETFMLFARGRSSHGLSFLT